MTTLLFLTVAFAAWVLLVVAFEVWPCEICGQFGHPENRCPVYLATLRRRGLLR